MTQIELVPAPPSTRPATNPWPQWPLILRTSSSHDEGGAREYGRKTTRLEGEGGTVSSLVSVGVELRDGRLVDRPGSEARQPVDLLLLAMGFVGPESTVLVSQLGVALEARGNVKVDGQFATSVPGVWAVGDARKGASLVAWAIADGRDAAMAVATALRDRRGVA